MSIGKLLNDGAKFKGDEKRLKLDYQGCSFEFKQYVGDGLFYVKLRRGEKEEECNEIEDWVPDGRGSPGRKKAWTKMNRDEAHRKWGHQHYDQMNWMANQNQIHLQGKLSKCAGCALVKCRAKANLQTTRNRAQKNGMRLFIDTTGPFPDSRGGMKYMQCAVDDKSDFNWVNFSRKKSDMGGFVQSLITKIKGRKMNIRY